MEKFTGQDYVFFIFIVYVNILWLYITELPIKWLPVSLASLCPFFLLIFFEIVLCSLFSTEFMKEFLFLLLHKLFL